MRTITITIPNDAPVCEVLVAPKAARTFPIDVTWVRDDGQALDQVTYNSATPLNITL